MSEAVVIQGRRLEERDVEGIRELIATHPEWSRRRLSEKLSLQWEWRNGAGRLKDMAARSLLVKLETRSLIRLPPRRQSPMNRMVSQRIEPQEWDRTPLGDSLHGIGARNVREVSSDPVERTRFAGALCEFHYLGYRGTVGENLQYTVTDKNDRLLACLLFGSAAWKCRARDQFIGWDPEQRARQLSLLTNNTRFMILPWARVPHLASWTLGQVLRRLSRDWQRKYGHPIVLVETFVERDRFAGTSYKAANWKQLDATTGRSRQDRYRTLRVPVKDVYLYPLQRRFREALCR